MKLGFMRLIFAANCLLFVLVSCGSDPVSRPFLAKAPSKNKQPKVEASVASKKKAFAGQVTFEEVAGSQLEKIRVIPESGRELIMPSNQTYDQVDGLWVMGATPGEWFKIPDYSEAWVGKQPEKFDGTAHLGSLKIYYRSSPVLRLVGAMKRGLKHPAWVPDSGVTKSLVASPWKSKLQ